MSDFPTTFSPTNQNVISSDCLQACGGFLMSVLNTAPASATWPSANRATFVPFLVYQDCVAVSMWVYNGAAASTGSIDIGIYDSSGNKLVSKGPTLQAGGANSLQVFDTADTALHSGQHYMAIVSSSASTTMKGWSGNPAIGLLRCMGLLQQGSAGTLPTTATFATATDTFLPLFGVALSASF